MEGKVEGCDAVYKAISQVKVNYCSKARLLGAEQARETGTIEGV